MMAPIRHGALSTMTLFIPAVLLKRHSRRILKVAVKLYTSIIHCIETPGGFQKRFAVSP
jgi:hypothetical protein